MRRRGRHLGHKDVGGQRQGANRVCRAASKRARMPLAAVLRRHVDQAQPAVLGAGHHHGVGLTIERIGLRFARQLEQRFGAISQGRSVAPSAVRRWLTVSGSTACSPAVVLAALPPAPDGRSGCARCAARRDDTDASAASLPSITSSDSRRSPRWRASATSRCISALPSPWPRISGRTERPQPAVPAAAGDQRHRHRFMAVGDDQVVVQAEILSAEAGGEGRPVEHEAHDVVFKTVAEDFRQFVAAVA